MADLLRMCSTIVTALRRKTFCEMYPAKPSRSYPNTRGQVAIEGEKCIACTLCAKKCPTGAIAVDRENNTWEINRGKCILCNECVSCCPTKALNMDNQYYTATVKIAIDKVSVKGKPAPKPKPVAKPEPESAPKEKKEEVKVAPKDSKEEKPAKK